MKLLLHLLTSLHGPLRQILQCKRMSAFRGADSTDQRNTF